MSQWQQKRETEREVWVSETKRHRAYENTLLHSMQKQTSSFQAGTATRGDDHRAQPRKAHSLTSVNEDHLFWHFKICSLTGYGPKLWKQFYWKRSPKHMSSTEDHIKLAAIEACSFLRHLCRFLQPWLFQQKLAWQRRRENGRNITQGLLKRHSGIHRRGILPLAQVKGQTGLALYNNMKSEFSTPPFLGWISATLAQISRPW